jgi:nucleoside-diphosphate-sugar epimerase
MPSETRTCALTGANGFVGRELKVFLERAGWKVVPWVRRPAEGFGGVEFTLGQAVNAQDFAGVEALVHCAYDFSLVQWEDIERVNVGGTRELLRAASEGGVPRLVLISSLSAFPGCRALYGRAKLEMEALTKAAGGYSVRPGLVYGDSPGGVFGKLVRQVRSSKIVPVISGGKQTQYLLHAEDLGAVVKAFLEGAGGPGKPISAAHEQPWEVPDILRQIALALGRKVHFLPVPWQLAWMGLRGLEIARLPTNFRSDSLISMVYQDPQPEFNAGELGIQCRPFALSERMIRDESKV